MKDITPQYPTIPYLESVVVENDGLGSRVGGVGGLGGKLATEVNNAAKTVEASFDNSNNFIGDIINARFDTQGKYILSDFTFGESGAIRINTDDDNGLWISPTGILGKKAGETTFAIDTEGNATFSGTITGSTITGGIFQTSTTGERISITNDVITIYDDDNNIISRLSGGGSFMEVIFPEGSTSDAISIRNLGTGGNLHIEVGDETNLTNDNEALLVINRGTNNTASFKALTNPSTIVPVVNISSISGQGAHLHLEPISSVPSSPTEGDIYTNTDHSIYYHNDTDFKKILLSGDNATGISVFGDGSDGDVTISTNTSLTRDMYYDDLTINAGVTLSPSGYRIFVKGTLTVNGTIARDGNDGGNGGNGGNAYDFGGGSAGSAGTAGSALSAGTLPGSLAGKVGKIGAAGVTTTEFNVVGNDGVSGDNGADTNNSCGVNGVIGVNGGDGGAAGGQSGGVGGSGGSAGTANQATYQPRAIPTAISFIGWSTATPYIITSSASSGGVGSGGSGAISAGASGGRAASGGAGGSGGGGSQGGIMVISAKNIIINSGGSIEAIGGNGGDGGDGGNGWRNDVGGRPGGSGGGAGGSGGQGGIIVLIYNSLTNDGTISVAGGSGGTGGSGSAATYGGALDGQDGNNGLTGTTGKIIQIIN